MPHKLKHITSIIKNDGMNARRSLNFPGVALSDFQHNDVNKALESVLSTIHPSLACLYFNNICASRGLSMISKIMIFFIFGENGKAHIFAK